MKQYPKWLWQLIFLCLVLIAMIFVENKNFDTIQKYSELSLTQQEELEELRGEYFNLLDEYQKLHDEYEEAKTVPMPTYHYTQEEVLLLAKTAQSEAGTVNPTALKYVAQVVLNRVANPHFPDTITEVVYQNNGVPQFSVAYNGMIDKCEVTPETMIAVQEVLLYGTDLPDYVEYFYAQSVRNNWVNTLPIHCTADGVVFAYSEGSLKRHGN